MGTGKIVGQAILAFVATLIGGFIIVFQILNSRVLESHGAMVLVGLSILIVPVIGIVAAIIVGIAGYYGSKKE